MYRKLSLGILIALSALQAPSAEAGLWDNVKGWFAKSEASRPPRIRLLVADDCPEVTLEVSGRYALYDPNTNAHISNRFVGKSMEMTSLTHGIKWGEEFPGTFQLKIVPMDPESTVAIDGVSYRGNMYVYDTGGTLSFVNELDLEDFLHYTLPEQITSSYPREAMAALAIAARTNAYHMVKHPKNTFWTVEGDSVGYYGCDVKRVTGIDDAIVNTRFMVMSTSTPYEGELKPFSSSWGPIAFGMDKGMKAQGKITINQAEDLADRGAHAAQILSKAFPGTSIMLTYAGK